MRRLDRLLAIALFLGARKRVRASDVAQRFNVSLRTVYRDMQALAHAGFPIEGNAGDGYRLGQDAYLRPLALNGNEAEALTVAAQSLAAAAEGPMREALASATAKLHAALPAPARQRATQLERRIAAAEIGESKAPTRVMLEAIRELHRVSLSYANPRTGKQSRRTIEPVGLVCVRDAWWLVAWCQLRRDARAFRVDCIANWKQAGHFTPRAGFSFDDIVQRDRGRAQELFGY